MSAFSEDELAYRLSERRLARIATVGPDGTPRVVPVGWTFNSGRSIPGLTRQRSAGMTSPTPRSSVTGSRVDARRS